MNTYNNDTKNSLFIFGLKIFKKINSSMFRNILFYGYNTDLKTLECTSALVFENLVPLIIIK